MQVFNIKKTLICLVIISSSLPALISFAEDFAEETISLERGFLSINVKDMRPEDLMKEISEKCKIDLIVLGEVFSEFPVSIRFNEVPVQEGIKRVLRRSGIPKHLMYFGTGDNGTKIVRLDLIGDKKRR